MSVKERSLDISKSYSRPPFHMSEYKASASNPITFTKILFKNFHLREENWEEGADKAEDADPPDDAWEQLRRIMESLTRQADPSDVTFTPNLFKLAVFLRTRPLNTADPKSPFFDRREEEGEEEEEEEEEGEQGERDSSTPDAPLTPEAPLTLVCLFLARYLPSEDPWPEYAAPLMDCIASLSLIWPPLPALIPLDQLLQSCRSAVNDRYSDIRNANSIARN
jgi:hypothetical protein